MKELKLIYTGNYKGIVDEMNRITSGKLNEDGQQMYNIDLLYIKGINAINIRHPFAWVISKGLTILTYKPDIIQNAMENIEGSYKVYIILCNGDYNFHLYSVPTNQKRNTPKILAEMLKGIR